MNIAERIKLEMRKRKITSPELAKATGIPLMTIQNILQQRSKKIEYIQKIAGTLNISLEELNKENTDSLNLQKYNEAVKIAINALEGKNLVITKNYIEDFVYTIYLYILQNSSNFDISVAYAEGLLERDISSNKVSKHN